MNRGRPAALVALAVLCTALVVATALVVPWRPLSGDVPGGHAAVAVAGDFTSAQVARARHFYEATRPVQYASLAVGLALVLLLGLTPLGGRLVVALGRPFKGRWVWQVLLGTVVLTFLGRLVSLPFDARGEAILRSFGLSTEEWGSWIVDQAKGFGMNAGLFAVVILALYALIRRFPRRWWAPAAVGGFLLVLGVSFAYPVVVEPAFNSFHPMRAGRLRSELLALAGKDHVPVRDVLVADASRRTTSLNAYVSGFGSTRRIVVYDTLLEAAPPEQVRLVVAHELGHAKRDDVLYGTLLGALGVSAGVCLTYLTTSSRRVQRLAGVTSMSQPRSIALLLMVVSVLSTLSMPVQNLASRHIEARADVHALDLTRDPETFTQMQRELAVRNLSALEPGSVSYYLFSTHPTPPQRIAMARDWARLHHRTVPPPLTVTKP